MEFIITLGLTGKKKIAGKKWYNVIHSQSFMQRQKQMTDDSFGSVMSVEYGDLNDTRLTKDWVTWGVRHAQSSVFRCLVWKTVVSSMTMSRLCAELTTL